MESEITMYAPDRRPAAIVLNGGWAFMHKLFLVVLPLVILLLSYVTSRVVVIDNTRFTTKDGLEVYKEIAAIREEMASFPDRAMLDRLTRIETRQDTMISAITRLEKAYDKGSKSE